MIFNMSKNETLKKLNDIKITAHFWNWLPDIQVAIEIYESRNDAYSVLLPFFFTYLEETIRSTTTEYGMLDPRNQGNRKKKVGKELIQFAISENSDNPQLVHILNDILENHYGKFSPFEGGQNRNNVGHGVVHPRFWTEEDFENVVNDIAKLSPYAGF